MNAHPRPALPDAPPSESSVRHWRLPLLVVTGLAVLMVSIASFRATGVPIRAPESAAVVIRELRFEDRPDGSIAVIEHRSGRQIAAIVGEAGFARGTLRGFARDRRVRSVGTEHPLQLIGRVDGRLTLVDPMTERVVDLESFGSKNAAAFGRLLTQQ